MTNQQADTARALAVQKRAEPDSLIEEVLDLKRVPHLIVKFQNGQANHLWNSNITNPIYMRGYTERNMLGADEVIIPWTSTWHVNICQRCRMGMGCVAAGVSMEGLVIP